MSSITTVDPTRADGSKVTLTTNDLVDRLNGGVMTRAQVLQAIAQSDEVSAREAVTNFVASQYYGYLRRAPLGGWL